MDKRIDAIWLMLISIALVVNSSGCSDGLYIISKSLSIVVEALALYYYIKSTIDMWKKQP